MGIQQKVMGEFDGKFPSIWDKNTSQRVYCDIMGNYMGSFLATLSDTLFVSLYFIYIKAGKRC